MLLFRDWFTVRSLTRGYASDYTLPRTRRNNNSAKNTMYHTEKDVPDVPDPECVGACSLAAEIATALMARGYEFDGVDLLGEPGDRYLEVVASEGVSFRVRPVPSLDAENGWDKGRILRLSVHAPSVPFQGVFESREVYLTVKRVICRQGYQVSSSADLDQELESYAGHPLLGDGEDELSAPECPWWAEELIPLIIHLRLSAGAGKPATLSPHGARALAEGLDYLLRNLEETVTDYCTAGEEGELSSNGSDTLAVAMRVLGKTGRLEILHDGGEVLLADWANDPPLPEGV